MRVSAKADYAVRAAAELAAESEGPVKGERLAEAQDIPLQFLEHILLELKHHGIVRARRGAKGGYWLAKPADTITVADVVLHEALHVRQFLDGRDADSDACQEDAATYSDRLARAGVSKAIGDSATAAARTRGAS